MIPKNRGTHCHDDGVRNETRHCLYDGPENYPESTRAKERTQTQRLRNVMFDSVTELVFTTFTNSHLFWKWSDVERPTSEKCLIKHVLKCSSECCSWHLRPIWDPTFFVLGSQGPCDKVACWRVVDSQAGQKPAPVNLVCVGGTVSDVRPRGEVLTLARLRWES